MENFLNISGSTSLALHAMAVISTKPDQLITAKEIATTLDASEAHLHKVLKSLVKSKILKSARGPKGGVMLKKPVEDVRLIEIVESIEGTIKTENCLFEARVCTGDHCIFGNLLSLVNTQVTDYLNNATLSDISGLFDTLSPAYS